MTTGGEPLDHEMFDPRYVVARRVLLDALFALKPHGAAFIVVGAQAVYLRTGSSDLAIAPYTTDGDLVLDPMLLGDDPLLETTMEAAGFALLVEDGERTQPGIWVMTQAAENGEPIVVPVDLIVPEGATDSVGRRGARLGVHGKQAARRAVGLEAALVDHDTMRIGSLDLDDQREISVEVAGVAALLVAKAHKIHDRVNASRMDRLIDKDAAECLSDHANDFADFGRSNASGATPTANRGTSNRCRFVVFQRVVWPSRK